MKMMLNVRLAVGVAALCTVNVLTPIVVTNNTDTKIHLVRVDRAGDGSDFTPVSDAADSLNPHEKRAFDIAVVDWSKRYFCPACGEYENWCYRWGVCALLSKPGFSVEIVQTGVKTVPNRDGGSVNFPILSVRYAKNACDATGLTGDSLASCYRCVVLGGREQTCVSDVVSYVCGVKGLESVPLSACIKCVKSGKGVAACATGVVSAAKACAGQFPKDALSRPDGGIKPNYLKNVRMQVTCALCVMRGGPADTCAADATSAIALCDKNFPDNKMTVRRVVGRDFAAYNTCTSCLDQGGSGAVCVAKTQCQLKGVPDAQLDACVAVGVDTYLKEPQMRLDLEKKAAEAERFAECVTTSGGDASKCS